MKAPHPRDQHRHPRVQRGAMASRGVRSAGAADVTATSRSCSWTRARSIVRATSRRRTARASCGCGPEDFTFGHSLNVGVQEARGRFIAIVSAHAIPANENWLEQSGGAAAPRRGRDGLRRATRTRDLEVLGSARLRAAVPDASARGLRSGQSVREQRQLRRAARPVGEARVRRGAARPRRHRVGEVLDGERPQGDVRAGSVHHPRAHRDVEPGAPPLSPRRDGSALGRHPHPAPHSG